MADYLKQFPGASDIKRKLEFAADKLVSLFNQNSTDDWVWFENKLSYSNAILPYALFAADRILSDKYREIAEKSCRFLLSQIYDGSHFSFIGSEGWFSKGGKKAKFDQQPVEVASTCLMLKAAYEVSGSKDYLKLQKKAFDWFLGDNDLGLAVYDFITKGCHDGLMECGINQNEGAESILSFLLSLLTLTENPMPSGKLKDDGTAFTEGPREKPVKNVSEFDTNKAELPIVDLPAKGRGSKNQLKNIK
jgi:hypothetical protein